MSRFNVTQHRAPWNKAAKWAFEEVDRIANDPQTGIKTVKQFAAYMNVTLSGMAAFGQDTAFQRGAQSVVIRTWRAGSDDVMGIDKPRSTDRAALIVSLKPIP